MLHSSVNPRNDAWEIEAGLNQEMSIAPKHRLNMHGRILRRKRVFARLRDGWAYDEVAREEGLTSGRIRQIVGETLKRRIVDDGADHAKLQLARLAPAMRLAGEAVAGGDVKAIAPLLKVLDRLDRYQKIAKANQEYDDGARERLMAKINRVAANLGLDKADEAAPAEAAKAGEPQGGAEPGQDAKIRSGVGVSL